MTKFFRRYAKRNFTSDVNECLTNNGGCDGLCINTLGSYKCQCPAGLKLDVDNKCIDINECLLRNGHGPCQGNCVNTWGSYHCSCDELKGTKLGEDGHTCDDIDECKDKNGGCSYQCVNTRGSYHCICPNGFILGDDWKTCKDVDECDYLDMQDEICTGACTNTIGSYHCI